MIADYPDPEMDAYPMHHVVPRLGKTPGSIRTPAPKLGEHTRYVLRDLFGMSADEYAALEQKGVLS